MAEIKWDVPFRESQTDRKVGVFQVRVWRHVHIDWNHPFDAVVDEWLHKAEQKDFINCSDLEKFLMQIPDATAIQVGTLGNNTVLYLG